MDNQIYGVRLKYITYPYAEGYGIISIDEALKELLAIKYPHLNIVLSNDKPIVIEGEIK